MTKLPLTVSSKLTNLEASGAVQLTAYANATPTAEKAPVLMAIQSEKRVDADTFANMLVQEGGQGTPAQARLAVNSIASVLFSLVDQYGAITVQTPFGTVQTFIAGTLENAQDQPDPETNYPFLAVVVPEVYRKLFAQFETYVPADACPATLRRVRDKATNRPGICGTQPFYLEGSGMTIGGAGEKLELLDEVTGELVTTATVDPDSASKVQLVCSLSSSKAVAAGTYKLRLTTLAGGETTLWPVDLKVTLVEAVPEPKKRITIDALTVDRESESIAIAVTHPEGTSEYSASGEFELVKVKLEAGGEEVSTFFGRNKGSEVPFSVSEWPTGLPKEGKLTVTLTPDPDKADEYDQTPAVKTEA